MAGVEGIEPPLTALEAVVIPLDHTPVVLSMAEYGRRASRRDGLFLPFFRVIGVFAAIGAMLAQGQLMAVLAPQIAAGVIVVVLALRALEANEGVLAHRGSE